MVMDYRCVLVFLYENGSTFRRFLHRLNAHFCLTSEGTDQTSAVRLLPLFREEQHADMMANHENREVLVHVWSAGSQQTFCKETIVLLSP